MLGLPPLRPQHVPYQSSELGVRRELSSERNHPRLEVLKGLEQSSACAVVGSPHRVLELTNNKNDTIHKIYTTHTTKEDVLARSRSAAKAASRSTGWHYRGVIRGGGRRSTRDCQSGRRERVGSRRNLQQGMKVVEARRVSAAKGLHPRE